MARGDSSLGGLGGSGSFQRLDQPLSYGDALAGIITTGLGVASEQKQKKNTQRQTREGLMGLGFSGKEAEALAKLPPPVMEHFIKHLSERGYSGAGAPEGMGQAMQQLGLAEQDDGQAMQQLGQMEQADQTPPDQQLLQQLSQQLQQPQGMQPLKEQLLQQQLQPQQPQQQFQQPQQQFQQPQTALQALQQPTRREQREEEKLAVQKEKLSEQRRQFERKEVREDQRDINKDTKSFYEETIKSNKGAQKAKARLGEMERLNEKGALSPGGWSAWRKFLSKPLGAHGPQFAMDWLFTADEQLFEKLSNEFVKDIKNFFPGRINEMEVKTFLKTIPQLEQTQEGRRLVIHNLNVAQDMSKAEYKVMADIIKENNGKRPAGLELFVEERLEPVREQLAKKFQWGAAVPAIPGAKFRAPVG